MYCKKCGNLLTENDRVCSKCGEPVVTEQVPNNNVVTGNSVNAQQPEMVAPAPEPVAPQPQVVQPQEQVMQQQQDIPNNVPNQQVNILGGQSVGGMTTPQPNMTSSMNANNNNGSFKIIIVVLIVVVLGLGGFIAYKALSKDNDDSNITNNNGSNNEVVNPVNNGDSGNTYEYKDFQLSLPSTYEASEDGDFLVLTSQSDKVASSMYIHNYVTIEDYSDNIEAVKASMTTAGYTIESTETKEYGGITWILMPCTYTYEGKTMEILTTFASLGNYHVMEALFVNYGSKTYDSVLTEFANMYNNATYKGTKQFSNNEEKGTVSQNAVPKFDSSLAD